jgi:hypothetical protein
MEEVLWERPPGTAGRAVVNFFGGGVQVTSGRRPVNGILPALIHYTSLKLENSSLQCVIFPPFALRCNISLGSEKPGALPST